MTLITSYLKKTRENINQVKYQPPCGHELSRRARSSLTETEWGKTKMNRNFRGLFFFAGLLLAFGITGCATPKIGPYAEQTAKLKSAVVGEQAEVKQRYAAIVELTKTVYGPDNCPKKILETDPGGLSIYCKEVQRSARFKKSASEVEAALTIAVAYSEKLKELADAGETGSEAFVELMGTVRDAADTVGVVVPGAVAAGGVAEKIGSEIAKAITRNQANQTLYQAMDVADTLWIPIMEEAISSMYADAGSQNWNAAGLATREIALRNSETGINLLAFYKLVAIDAAPDTRLEAYLGRLSDTIGSADPGDWVCRPGQSTNCIQGTDLQSLAAAYELLGVMGPRFDRHAAKVDAALKWEAERIETAERIVAAVAVWRMQHAKITEYLRSCGTFEGGIFECKELNLATLISMIESLKEASSNNSE